MVARERTGRLKLPRRDSLRATLPHALTRAQPVPCPCPCTCPCTSAPPPKFQARSTRRRYTVTHTRDLSRPLTSIATLARASPHTTHAPNHATHPPQDNTHTHLGIVMGPQCGPAMLCLWPFATLRTRPSRVPAPLICSMIRRHSHHIIFTVHHALKLNFRNRQTLRI